jgi:hypothetical protein
MNRDELILKAVGKAVGERLDRHASGVHSALYATPPAEVKVIVSTAAVAEVMSGIREDLRELGKLLEAQGALIARLAAAILERPPVEFSPVFSPEFKPVTNVTAPKAVVTVELPKVEKVEVAKHPKSVRLEVDKAGNRRAVPEY